MIYHNSFICYYPPSYPLFFISISGLRDLEIQFRGHSHIMYANISNILTSPSFPLVPTHTFYEPPPPFVRTFYVYPQPVVIYGPPAVLSQLSGLSPQKYSLKKSLMFFLIKPYLKKFLIFSQKRLPNFQKTELSCIFLKKVFLIFRERYIQNPGLFRTLVYSKHCDTPTLECFAKIAT